MRDTTKRYLDIFRARMLKSEPVAQMERPVTSEGEPYGKYHPRESRKGLPERTGYHYNGSGQSDHRLDALWLADLPPDAPEGKW